MYFVISTPTATPPTNRHQPTPRRGAQHLRGAPAVGRTEELRVLAYSVEEHTLAALDLAFYLRSRSKDQVGMGEGVVADDVAGGCNLLSDFRALDNKTPNQEKSGR